METSELYRKLHKARLAVDAAVGQLAVTGRGTAAMDKALADLDNEMASIRLVDAMSSMRKAGA
jgi:hypothetical protein